MRAVNIHGTVKKIQELVDLSKQALRDGAYRVATRLHAVALNMEGKTAPQIADILKVHRSKVSIWLRNWQQTGMDGVLEGHRSGRPLAMYDKQRQKLADILDSGPVAYGFTSGVWTSPMVARVIEEEFSFEDLKKFRSLPSKLTGHGESHLNPEGVLLSNGPLRSSVGQAQGLAMADKAAGRDRVTIVVVSDGASMEGEAKEAFAAIPVSRPKGGSTPSCSSFLTTTPSSPVASPRTPSRCSRPSKP